MIKLLIDKLPRVTKNRKNLEFDLEVKIENRGKEVYIEGDGENEYIAQKVLEALDLGFPYAEAVSIKKEGTTLEEINIKDHTKRADLASIRARIIGLKGRTIRAISNLSNCHLELKDNKVGIIGRPEFIKNAETAIISLIKGAKQANVYRGLEKNQIKAPDDLGLKE